ncbi:hypothetical protein ACJX0J_016484, partial [Zea mays]
LLVEGSESFATFHILAAIGNVFSAPYVCSSTLFNWNGSGGRYISNEKLLAYVAQVTSQGKLLMWGAKISSLIDRGQFWRLATSSLLHANLTHLALTSYLLDVVIMMQFNCFSLNSIGPMVEMLSGPRRYLAVYFSLALAERRTHALRWPNGCFIGGELLLLQSPSSLLHRLLRRPTLSTSESMFGCCVCAHCIDRAVSLLGECLQNIFVLHYICIQNVLLPYKNMDCTR